MNDPKPSILSDQLKLLSQGGDCTDLMKSFMECAQIQEKQN